MDDTNASDENEEKRLRQKLLNLLSWGHIELSKFFRACLVPKSTSKIYTKYITRRYDPDNLVKTENHQTKKMKMSTILRWRYVYNGILEIIHSSVCHKLSTTRYLVQGMSNGCEFLLSCLLKISINKRNCRN